MTNPSTERGGAWRQLAKNVLTNYLSLLLSGVSLLVLFLVTYMPSQVVLALSNLLA